MLGGIETSSAKATMTTAHGAEPASATTKLEPPHGGNANPLLGPTGTSPLNGLLPLTGTGTGTAKTSAATTAIGITPAAAIPGQGGTHSIIGTPPPTLAKPTYIRPTDHPNAVTETDSHTILVAATATAYNGNNGETASMPSAPSRSSGPSSQEWRIIGVAVSAVSVVGAGILAVVFFDQWWGFLTACCCAGRRKKDGVEELVPDWEGRDWEWNNDKEGRFPNFGTPPVGAQGMAQETRSGTGNGNGQGGQSRWSSQLGRAVFGGGSAGSGVVGGSWKVGTIAPAALANAYGINGKHSSAISTNFAGLGLHSLGVLPSPRMGMSPVSNNSYPRSPSAPIPVMVRPTQKQATPTTMSQKQASQVRTLQPVGLTHSSTTKSTFIPDDAYDGLAF